MKHEIEQILNFGATHYAVSSISGSASLEDSTCFYKQIDGKWYFKTIRTSVNSSWALSNIIPEEARRLVPVDATHRRPVAVRDGQIGYDFYKTVGYDHRYDFYRYNKLNQKWNMVSYISEDTIEQMEEINKPRISPVSASEAVSEQAATTAPTMAQKMRMLAENASYTDLLRDIDAEARKGNVQLKISATGALIDRERLKKDGFIVTSVTGNFVIHW